MTEPDQAAPHDIETSELRSRNAFLESALQEAHETADRRLVEFELKTEALKRGMIHLDGLKLLEPEDIKPDEHGNVKGASAAISRLQRQKPWLFTGANSSSLSATPQNIPARFKLATEMTLEEWKQARSELLRRR